MTFTLPDLPYEFDALEPYIDAKTMELHHDKHHATYVKKLNEAVEGTEFADKDVNELLNNIEQLPEDKRQAVINHGGGHSNHSFWWPMLKKDTEYSGEIAEAINNKFGSFESFKEQFTKSALGLFGSGWCWLVVNNGELEIRNTSNQDSPLMDGQVPVLAIDMWEHSFYKLRGPDKAGYLEAFFSIINWEKVNENFQAKQ
jgi:superoxide dismutase, Fe-Mn family